MSAIPPTANPSQKAPPMLRGGRPFLGHRADFVRDTIGLLQRARRECGDIPRIRVVGKDMVLMSGPELHEAFFRAPDEQLSQSEAYKMMVPVPATACRVASFARS
jgi:sterol 14-demethylase